MKQAVFSAIIFLFAANSFALKGKHVFITTDDNWTLHALYHNPYSDSQEGDFFLLIHTQRKNLYEFSHFMRQIEKRGYGYLALDLRGHGKSLTAPNGSTTTYKTFRTGGIDNQYNKMTRDIDAAVKFLREHQIEEKRIILMGTILGANLAIKAAAINQNIGGVIALTPILNANDVRSVNPLRAYGKRPIFLISSARGKRQYKEFQLLNDIAKTRSGKENVTVSIQKRGVGAKLLNSYTIGQIFVWVKNFKLPTVYIKKEQPKEIENAEISGEIEKDIQETESFFARENADKENEISDETETEDEGQ